MGNNILSFSHFDSVLLPLLQSYHAQTYYGLVLYLFLAVALCGLLAALAYLFSLSSVQDSEKRSEYECGFEPFDSATRLPFDVHFYLVGILFLIFDVEIALLFPWVLSLRVSGWFGFYLMLGFIFILAIGFLYEWKRGALIWPSRQQELTYSAVGAKTNGVGRVFGFLDQSSDSFTFSWAKYALAPLFFSTCVDSSSIAAAAVVFVSTRPRVKALPKRLVKNAAKRLSACFTNDSTLARWERMLTRKKFALMIRMQHALLCVRKTRYTSLHSYIRAMKVLESQLLRRGKAIRKLITKAGVTFALARNQNFHDEETIQAAEKAFFSALTRSGVVQTYQKVVTAYRGLYKDLKANRRIKKSTPARLVTALLRDLKARTSRMFIQSRKLQVTRREARQKLRAVLTETAPRKRLVKKTRARKLFHHAVAAFPLRRKRYVRFAALIPVVSVTATDSYALQFIGNFLPEMVLTTLITAVLTVLAIELGQGRSYKMLALESLAAFKEGFLFIAGLYLVQLFYGSTAVLFNGYAVVSAYTVFLKLLTILAGQFILSHSELYLRQHRRHLLEYPTIMALALLLMLLLVGSGHLVSAFLALVGFSLNLYVLILFDATAAVAREAGIKYFYLSTLSSGLILYSVFAILLALGTGQLFDISQILATNTELVLAAGELLHFALVLIMVGLFFKLSAFPGHLWAADVYEGSPDPIASFFMLPVKVAVLAFTIQLLAAAFEPAAALWQPLVAISAIVSLVWGCLAALAEKKTKRFLAYASINQMGFLLMGLATGTLEGYRTTLLYLLIYVVMNIGFLTVFLCARRASDGFSFVYLTDFRHFGFHRLSWSLAMILLSMAGIPPLAGFFGKYYLLLHAQEQELYGLVIVGLVTSLVSTYYYLRIIKIMWFDGYFVNPGVLGRPAWGYNALRVSEFALWIFICFSGVATTQLDVITEGLFLFHDFATTGNLVASASLFLLHRTGAHNMSWHRWSMRLWHSAYVGQVCTALTSVVTVMFAPETMVKLCLLFSERYMTELIDHLIVALTYFTSVNFFLFCQVGGKRTNSRGNQLMDIGWKIFLPLSTGLLLLVIGLLMAYDAHPVVGELASELYAEPQLGNAIPAAEREKQLEIVQSNALQRDVNGIYVVAGVVIAASLAELALFSMGVPVAPGVLSGLAGVVAASWWFG